MPNTLHSSGGIGLATYFGHWTITSTSAEEGKKETLGEVIWVFVATVDLFHPEQHRLHDPGLSHSTSVSMSEDYIQ